MLSFSVKWADESLVKTYALADYPRFKRDSENDRSLIYDFWKVLNEADVVIAHNGDAFDLKKGNTRFVQHGLKPPAPYKSIDTLKIARRYFKFDSNKLDDLGSYLGVGRKLPHTGKHLWFGCMAGDKKSWRTMRRYNARDVLLLERVYHKLKPWAQNHPDLRLYTDSVGCPVCESTRTQRRGFAVARKRKYHRFQCSDCGYWFHEGQVHEAPQKKDRPKTSQASCRRHLAKRGDRRRIRRRRR